VSISHVMISSLPLFQLPGEVDSLSLQQGVHVVSYHNRLLPVHKISMPSHLPSDATPSSSAMHMPFPSNDSNSDMEIPAAQPGAKVFPVHWYGLVGKGMGNTSKAVIDLLWMNCALMLSSLT